jgi:hypothetical protein
MLPDVDVAWNDWNDVPELLAHRGFTHSLAFAQVEPSLPVVRYSQARMPLRRVDGRERAVVLSPRIILPDDAGERALDHDEFERLIALAK